MARDFLFTYLNKVLAVTGLILCVGVGTVGFVDVGGILSAVEGIRMSV